MWRHLFYLLCLVQSVRTVSNTAMTILMVSRVFDPRGPFVDDYDGLDSPDSFMYDAAIDAKVGFIASFERVQ